MCTTKMYKTIVHIVHMANISVHINHHTSLWFVSTSRTIYNIMVMLSSLVVVLVEVFLIKNPTAHYCYLSKFKTNKNTISKLDIIPNLW